MKTGPKYKICKRLGSSVFEKCQTQRFLLSEARAAKNKKRRTRRGGLSDYGRQLLEKQRMRYTYGISEKQFAGYVKKAMESGTVDPKEKLIQLLEMRLDNVVYRAGLARTRRLARQLVSHGHITVNGRRSTIPSYQVRVGDTIAVREGSRVRSYFQQLAEGKENVSTPLWLSFDFPAFIGEIVSLPALDNTDMHSDLTEVLSFYSR